MKTGLLTTMVGILTRVFFFLFQMTASVNQNPWNIKSLNDLQFFNCPSCEFKAKFGQDLVDHALNHHFMESSYYLKNIQYGSTDDIKNLSGSTKSENIEDDPAVIVKTEVVEENISEVYRDSMLDLKNSKSNFEIDDIDIEESTVKSEIFEDLCENLSESYEVNVPPEKPRFKCQLSEKNKIILNLESHDTLKKIHEYKVHQMRKVTKAKAKTNNLEKEQKSSTSRVSIKRPRLNSNMNKLESRVKTKNNNKKKLTQLAKSQVERTQKSRKSRKETEFMVCLFRNPAQGFKCDVVQYRIDRMVSKKNNF